MKARVIEVLSRVNASKIDGNDWTFAVRQSLNSRKVSIFRQVQEVHSAFTGSCRDR